MENIHNGPKRAKNYDNDILELIFLTVQLDKDLLRLKNDFYKFWHHSLQVINKQEPKKVEFFSSTLTPSWSSRIIIFDPV